MFKKSRHIKTSLIIFLGISILCFYGCETLQRKFTRKPKGGKENTDEVIYAPEEYPAKVLTSEQQYRDYYARWRGWAQEFDDTLVDGGNRKRQVMCITEMVGNLNKMKEMLASDAQAGLDGYIAQVLPIKDAILGGTATNADHYWMKIKIDSIGSRIEKTYAPRKIKNRLIP